MSENHELPKEQTPFVLDDTEPAYVSPDRQTDAQPDPAQAPEESTEKPVGDKTASPTESDKESEEDYSADLIIKAQNVFIDVSPFKKDDTSAEGKPTIPIPSSFPSYVNAQISAAPNTALDDTEKTSRWANAVQRGLSLIPVEDMYRDALEDPNAQWAQSVDFNGKALRAQAAQFSSASGETMHGERGMLRFMNYIGQGATFTIPLWSTGIWVTLKNPSDLRLLELHREITSDKISLGRNSYGLALSATSSVYTERLLRIVIESVYKTNLKTDKHLFDVISSHDIPSLIWGLACVIWNDGFRYERACTHDPAKCNHVEQERLDLQVLQNTNRAIITPWQRAHMARMRTGEVSMEDIERYKNEFLHTQPNRVSFKGRNGQAFTMDLKVPTIRQYLEQSNLWIDSMIEMIEGTVKEDANPQERNAFIAQMAQATTTRQYGHWVDSIQFDNNSIIDRDTISNILNTLSSEDEVREHLLTEIKKYINKTTTSIIGIPSYKCSHCHKEQVYDKSVPNMESIIPMDIIQTFFYLHVQKLILIGRR